MTEEIFVVAVSLLLALIHTRLWIQEGRLTNAFFAVLFVSAGTFTCISPFL